jgi:hypothetical protein
VHWQCHIHTPCEATCVVVYECPRAVTAASPSPPQVSMMREGQGDRFLLIVLVMSTLWNSCLLLSTQRQLANTKAEVDMALSNTKVQEQSRQALDNDLNEELKWFEKSVTRQGEVWYS